MVQNPLIYTVSTSPENDIINHPAPVLLYRRGMLLLWGNNSVGISEEWRESVLEKNVEDDECEKHEKCDWRKMKQEERPHSGPIRYVTAQPSASSQAAVF